MKKQILKDLAELEKAAIISSETAQKIKDFYQAKEEASGNRLLTIFGVLGACLVGLGIILIIAHNWDDLSRSLKTVLAFLPLLIGQVIAFYVMLKKRDSAYWRESAATFLFFAIGACISLVSQIYHIPGNLSSYLLTWSLLGLPVFYLMQSSMVSLLYIGGITWFACETEYFSYGMMSGHYYWLLLGFAIPYYARLIKDYRDSNFTTFHHWFMGISMICTLGIFGDTQEQWMFPAYLSLFGIYYAFGRSKWFSHVKRRNNAWLLLGSLGSLVLLLIFSFDSIWKDLAREDLILGEIVGAVEFWVFVILTVAGFVLYSINHLSKEKEESNPVEFVFILFAAMFVLGHYYSIYPIIMTNLIVLIVGLYYVRFGSRLNNLGLLNYGLLIITALVICRFFDADISFVLRGLLFILVGVGFFVANSRMLKKRKSHE